MNNQIVKTRNQAIKLAKSDLRNLIGKKTLHNIIIKNTSTRCECGETGAVDVMLISDCHKSVIVGYCQCGEKY